MRPVWLLLALVVAGLACAPFFVNDYVGIVMDTAGAYAIVAVGLSLLSGGTGQFSLGHAGFFAIGAFTAGVLNSSYGWPFWLDVPAGGLLAALAGVALGVPALRLSGPYLSIATLGFSLLVAQVLQNANWAGGHMGLTPNPPGIGPYVFGKSSFFWVVLAVLVITAVAAHNLRRGATGRAFIALRESEPAAQASGVNLARYRVVAFVISALYAGLAGALSTHWADVLSAQNFDVPSSLSLSITFLAMIVVGGLSSTTGAVIGAVFLTGLTEALQGQPQLATTLYGAIMIAALLFLPGGLTGLVALVRRGRRGSRLPLTAETSHG